MFANVLLILLTFFGAVIYLFTPPSFWVVGAVIVFFTWLAYLFFVFPNKSSKTRGQWAFLACFVILATAIAALAKSYLETNPIFIEISRENLRLIPYAEVTDVSISVSPNLVSIITGIFCGLVLTLILFTLIGYLSSIYVLALHEEDLTFGTALRSFLLLIFNKQLTWLRVQNGEIEEIKAKGYVNKWLSRGKVIVKPGNAIILEKGGKITGIHGPGTAITVKDETIREVFDLRPQFVVRTLDSVITADRVPLEITLGVGYRLIPYQENGNGNGSKASKVIKESNYGLFPILEETLIKAAFRVTSGKWHGFAQGASANLLRDQIMAHRFDEIFEIQNGEAQDIAIRVDNRQVSLIEQTIKDTVNGFAHNVGVEITTVDISQIHFPDDVREAIKMRIRSQAEAEAIQKIEAERNQARGELVNSILESISNQTNKPISDIQLQLATFFADISRRALTDDILGYEYVKVLEKLASTEGTKIFNATPNQSAFEPELHRLSIPFGTTTNGNGK